MDLFNPETSAQCQDLRVRCEGKLGFTASCFDILHAGHTLMLKDARENCDFLVVALQTDPTIDRPQSKNKPVQTYAERELMLKSIRYVDAVIKYATEADLVKILHALKPDVRILGTDYKGKPFTGDDIPIPIHWHNRNHNWSTTWLRERVYLAEQVKRAEL